MAATALVGATASTASAAPVSGVYQCANSAGVGLGNFTTTINATLPATAKAGASVPAGLLPAFTAQITSPANTATLLTTTTSGKSSDFSVSIGSTAVSAPITATGKTVNPDNSVTFEGKGTNAAFVTPGAGTYSINMPAKFTLQGTDASGNPTVTATCQIATPPSLGSVTISKQDSTVSAKAKAAKVKVVVTNEFGKTGGEIATGKVTVKDGKKKIGKGTLKNGKVTIKLKGNKKLSKGKHKLVISYAGDDFTSAAKAKVTVKIK